MALRKDYVSQLVDPTAPCEGAPASLQCPPPPPPIPSGRPGGGGGGNGGGPPPPPPPNPDCYWEAVNIFMYCQIPIPDCVDSNGQMCCSAWDIEVEYALRCP